MSGGVLLGSVGVCRWACICVCQHVSSVYARATQ